MEWYYVVGKDRVGPVSETDFNELIDNGTITPKTHVWNKSMTEWQRLETLSVVQDAPHADDTKKDDNQDNIAVTTYACSECGESFPEDELVTFESSKVCVKCKPNFIQKIREGVAVGNVQFAGFWIRVAAKLIDGLLLMVVNLAIGFVVAAVMSSADDPSVVLASTLIASAFQICVAAGYSCYFLGKYGATIGKMACGLKVITGEHDAVSYLKGFGRYFAEVLSSIVLLIGYIMVAFDSEKRGLHDRICNTRVVYKKSLEA